MDTTVAMFLIAGGAVALLIVLYASIADKWLQLKDERDNLREQHDRLETLYDRQRDMITSLQRKVIELDELRNALAKQAYAKKPAKSNKHKNRSKGFTANNDINVWHKVVPYEALVAVQARIDEGKLWSNIAKGKGGWTFRIAHKSRVYNTKIFNERHEAKQFRDLVLAKYFQRNYVGARQ